MQRAVRHALRGLDCVGDAMPSKLLHSLPECCVSSLTPHPCDSFGSKFTFEPEAGTLAPGAMTVIKACLCSDALGAFDEAFHWHLAGSSEPVTLTIKGRVIGPTFELDADAVDFGLVSFGFRCASLHACTPLKRLANNCNKVGFADASPAHRRHHLLDRNSNCLCRKFP